MIIGFCLVAIAISLFRTPSRVLFVLVFFWVVPASVTSLHVAVVLFGLGIPVFFGGLIMTACSILDMFWPGSAASLELVKMPFILAGWLLGLLAFLLFFAAPIIVYKIVQSHYPKDLDLVLLASAVPAILCWGIPLVCSIPAGRRLVQKIFRR